MKIWAMLKKYYERLRHETPTEVYERLKSEGKVDIKKRNTKIRVIFAPSVSLKDQGLIYAYLDEEMNVAPDELKIENLKRGL
jgi:hypothetical protein